MIGPESLPRRLVKISPMDFVLDGEAVRFNKEEETSLGGLQDALKFNPEIIILVASDLLNQARENIRNSPLPRSPSPFPFLEKNVTKVVSRKVAAMNQGKFVVVPEAWQSPKSQTLNSRMIARAAKE